MMAMEMRLNRASAATRLDARLMRLRCHALERRAILSGVILSIPSFLVLQPLEAEAGFKKELKKKKLLDGDYVMNESSGLRLVDLDAGSGEVIQPGDAVVVHFDVLYRGIDVASSRSARLLGANRTIAEPYEFTAGGKVDGTQVKKINDSAGGLFSGQGGPKPPPALSRAVLGMKKGGKRSILIEDVNRDGYGAKGVGELPGGTPFTLNIEILNSRPK